MGKLALLGGTSVRAKSAPWPKWPIHTSGDVKLITEVTKSDRWSFDGPTEWNFAEAFKEYLGANYGLCCGNGTVGIQLALEALDVGAYDEVLVPGLTWQATAAAPLDINAIPILVDVEPDTWCIDLDKAEAAVTKKTKALIVVHLYGCMPDMTRVAAFCRKHKLILIEDCAHQHGSRWKGRAVGSFGDAASFSFQESKVLSCGEGGFNTCKTKAVFERLYSLRNCGRGFCGDYTNSIQSGNYRLTEWQAAILTGGLARLDKQVKHRDANAIYLNSLLAEIPGVLPMRRRKEITQQSYFNFTWRLDLSKFKRGVTNRQVCKALNAELHPSPDADFEPPYEALNNCSLYRPHTKPRYKISAEYWRAVNPRRFKLPVSKDAREKTGIAVHHSILMGTKKDMEDIAKAMAKIVEHSADLV